MVSVLKNNRDLNCYFITKHSWKGKYKRIFSVGSVGITTYNPVSLEVTNQWPYEDFLSIRPSEKAHGEFNMTMRKTNKKTDTMRFSTDHRADLLTEALRFHALFADKTIRNKSFPAGKYHWSERRVGGVVLSVRPSGIHHSDANDHFLCCYDYKDIQSISIISDLPQGMAIEYGGFGRMHIFTVESREELIKSASDAAQFHIGIIIKTPSVALSFDHCMANKFGKHSNDESLTSCCEFTVTKLTNRPFNNSLVLSNNNINNNNTNNNSSNTNSSNSNNNSTTNSPPKNSNSPSKMKNSSTTTNKPTADIYNVRRILCITETCTVERDLSTYNAVTCKPLSEIFAIVRSVEKPQQFSIEYVKGGVRTYTSTDRDALLASLLDGVRASGNRDVHVKMRHTCRGHRLGPFTVPVDEEVESQHLKILQHPPPAMGAIEVLSRFNSNVSYSGLLHAVTADTLFAENKERLIKGALLWLLEGQSDVRQMALEELEGRLHALRRLVASKAGFAAFTTLPQMREKVGLKVVKSLKRNDLGVSHAAIDMLCALIQPMHDNYDLRQEQLNKSSVLSTKKFLENLLDMFNAHVNRGSGALVVSAMLDFLTYSLCTPYSETTEAGCFDSLLEMVASNGRPIFKLFQHPSMAVVKGAGLLMKAIIEEGEASISARMQNLALAEGALPRHLHTALYTSSTDARLLTVRQLSRHLLGLWVAGHEPSMLLLRRIFPSGLTSYLESSESVNADDDVDRINVRDNLKIAQEQDQRMRKNMHIRELERHVEGWMMHWRQKMGVGVINQQQGQQDKVVVLRKRRQRIKSELNWSLFYRHFSNDHSKPDLIWNHKTREELRVSLEEEMRWLLSDQDLHGNTPLSWNHYEFNVVYHSLADEIKIGDYYLRVLLEEDGKEEASRISHSNDFFNCLYHRFLLSSKQHMKCHCLHAMALVYSRCHEELGTFHDTKYIIQMLEKCTERTERDRLVIFLSKLMLNKENARELIEGGGVRVLVDLLTLAHLHVHRAVVPLQSNVLEASTEQQQEQRAGEKEWYYSNADKERLGPFSFVEMKESFKDELITSKTRCWSQGMEGWKSLQQIPQLKWTLMASGTALLHESALACLVLDVLISVCHFYPSRDAENSVIRPLPRIKRHLSDPPCLPHIVQLLVTFDPTLVEKVASLLSLVMDQNPLSTRLYLSGVFFFILMYTGSNILPIARFLKNTHLKQSFRSDEKNSEMMARSILGHILPEAMVCYLENHDVDKFSEIFLGEFDTPEAIWSGEMRRLMIEKIAGHVGDFTPRLLSNTRALYQYCPIPVVIYPALQKELFCHTFYLRHLCDVAKFPDWPVKEPIILLKRILEAWRDEVDKKPALMSVEEAYQALELTPDCDDLQVRKAYRRLVLKYHPDKNPEGRELFEAVNKAYEFLCTRATLHHGPNPENIILILKAQSILFSRFQKDLEAYKYAGYPMLMKTITMETNDNTLFSKESCLLVPASDLAYHILNCSALNAEEMRREGGIQILYDAFNRCAGVLNQSSKQQEVSVQVCTNVVKCMRVAGLFEECRQLMVDKMAGVPVEVVRTLYFQNLPELCHEASACVAALSVSQALQTSMLHAGVLWHLLLLLFQYDYTLEEGGVERKGETNQQEVRNSLAKISVHACASLAGYHEDTPDNPVVKDALSSLMMPFLANKLTNQEPHELLKLFHSNSENPLLLWNNHTRLQLKEYLTEQQNNIIKTGECDSSYGSGFQFEAHQSRLIVGGVFVDILNKQPSFVLPDPKSFVIHLLDYLGSQAQYLHSLNTLLQQQQQHQTTIPQQLQQPLQPQQRLLNLANSHNISTKPSPAKKPSSLAKKAFSTTTTSCNQTTPHSTTTTNIFTTTTTTHFPTTTTPTTPTNDTSVERMLNVEACLEALCIVITNNTGVELQCIGHFRLLFSLLAVYAHSSVQQHALKVISCVSSNVECITDISLSQVMPSLLLTLPTLPSCHLLTLQVLKPLSSNTKLLKEIINKGGLIYLLDLFSNSSVCEVRRESGVLMGRMMADKLVGPKIKLILAKFLPSIFMDAMKDDSEAAVNLFEGNHENPELIWTEEVRKLVSRRIAGMKNDFYTEQRKDATTKWIIDEATPPLYSDGGGWGELAVGGVYLRLFIQNPGWVVQRPKEFMVELFEKWSQLASDRTFDVNGDSLEMVSCSLIALLTQQPSLLDQVPQLGYIPHLFSALPSPHAPISNTALKIILQLADSAVCIRSMSQMECIGGLKAVMAREGGGGVGVASEALMKITAVHNEDIVEQAIKTDLVAFLLQLLSASIAVLSASVRAQVVKCLKALQMSAKYGTQISEMLDKSKVWNEYSSQKHDLFLTDRPVSGYLTGSGVAGYLTSATPTTISSIPPPMP